MTNESRPSSLYARIACVGTAYLLLLISVIFLPGIQDGGATFFYTCVFRRLGLHSSAVQTIVKAAIQGNVFTC